MKRPKPATRSSAKPKYKRILLKMSGEVLGGEAGLGICAEMVHEMAADVREVADVLAGHGLLNFSRAMVVMSATAGCSMRRSAVMAKNSTRQRFATPMTRKP